MPTNDKNRRVTRAGAVRACGVVCVVVLAASVFAEIDRTRLALIDPLVEDAIGDGLLPGAVVVVGHAGEIVYEGAFGARAVDGLGESMTPDTIFDLASLTKVVATTTSVMILVEARLAFKQKEPPDVEEYPEASAIICAYLPNEAGTILNTVEEGTYENSHYHVSRDS